MRQYRIVFTPRSERQLEHLYNYIADRSGAERADSFVSGIVEHCLSLSTFPERGTHRDDIRPHMRIIGHARRVTIAFSVDAETSAVVIHGIFYGGQDFVSALHDDKDDH